MAFTVEVQYRTGIQHAWATAVEVIGFITTSQPKFEKGDTIYQYVMALASEIMARAYEDMFGAFPEKSNIDLVKEFLKLEKKINLLNMLRGLNSTNTSNSGKKNAILIFSKTGDLEIKTFRSGPEALRALFELEKDQPENDIVLVKADTSEEVRFAFKNYFSDAQDFINLVEQGCQVLAKENISSYDRATLASMLAEQSH